MFTKKLGRWFVSNISIKSSPHSKSKVMKSAFSEDFKTVLTFDIWPSGS